MIITTAIIKGGSGKSTTAAALLQAAAEDGKAVLAVDLDPQANLTAFIAANQNQAGSYQLLTGTPAAELIQHTAQQIDVIAGSPDLADIKTTPGSAKRLRSALDAIKDSYDLIVIDTPPQMGELTFNALQAADALLIPVEADTSNIQGLYQIADIAAQMQRSNPILRICGTVITRYDGRSKINKYLQSVIADQAQQMDIPYCGEIRNSIAVKEAQAMQQSLFKYAARCNAAADYKRLYKEIIGR